MLTEPTAEELAYAHSRGHHVVIMNAQCERCRKGDPITLDEAIVALVERDAESLEPGPVKDAYVEERARNWNAVTVERFEAGVRRTNAALEAWLHDPNRPEH